MRISLPTSGCFVMALLTSLSVVRVQAQSATVELANETAINTTALEFSPTFYEDGVVFISSNSAGLKKKKDDDIKMQTFSILQSKRNTEGALGTPTAFSEALSTKLHEGPVCFNATGDVIYFSSNILKKGKKSKSDKRKMKIYTSAKTGEAWSEPVELPFNPDGKWDVCHPTLSIEGDRLIFASDQPGGQGKMDLYASYKVGETWSEPVNLGKKVNTNGNDVFPFLHADNTLYYSSDNKSKGGLDIYYATADGSEYVEPINVGAPFNTAGDDFGLIVDLNKVNGYLASNGNGGAGTDDILSFHVANGNLDEYLLLQGRGAKRQLDLAVTVVDQAGKPIPNAELKLIKLDQGLIIGRDSAGNLITLKSENGADVISTEAAGQPTLVESTDANGRFLADVPPGSFIINAAKPGYKSKQMPVMLVKTGNEYTLQLDAAEDMKPFKTVLMDEATGAPLKGAMIVLTNTVTGAKETVYTDENGAVDTYLANGDHRMEVYQNNTLIGESTLTANQITEGGKSAKLSLSLGSESGLRDGSVIELRNIYYNFNDATLRPDARKDLDPLVAMLNQYPKMRIRINSHTDSRGSSSSNQELSAKRAKSVHAYLLKKGIKASRLEVKGFGESNVRNKCKEGVECEEKDHAKNRRTEIEVLGGLDTMKVAYRDGSLGLDNGPKVNKAPGGKLTFSSGTKFYLVAGSFLMQTRANARLTELVKAGYADASIVQFPKSPYYSVCVDILETYEGAQKLKTAFFDKTSIESFVRPE